MIKRILTLAAAGAASLGLALAVPAGAVTHPHATTVCGVNCDDVSGELLGPSFILNASGVGRDTASPFAHRICSGVLQSASKSAGLATTMTAPRARLVATLKRCGS